MNSYVPFTVQTCFKWCVVVTLFLRFCFKSTCCYFTLCHSTRMMQGKLNVDLLNLIDHNFVLHIFTCFDNCCCKQPMWTYHLWKQEGKYCCCKLVDPWCLLDVLVGVWIEIKNDTKEAHCRVQSVLEVKDQHRVVVFFVKAQVLSWTDRWQESVSACLF